jgi:hypothetical protein
VDAGPSGDGFTSQFKIFFIQSFLSFQSQFDELSFCPLNVDNLEGKLLFPECVGKKIFVQEMVCGTTGRGRQWRGRTAQALVSYCRGPADRITIK